LSGTEIHLIDLLPFAATTRAVQAIAGDGASLKRVEIRAGTAGQRHSHPHEQFVVVLNGRGQLDCAVGEIALTPGTVLHFAPGAWHQAAFSEDTVLLEVNLTNGRDGGGKQRLCP
jgi:quercetin dioxygenase-like cupin family protein